jgi:7-keto-8-aminopelargonate synthetase-like enzyme
MWQDECHATGFMGPTGRGTDEHWGILGQVDIVNSTLGKAMGGATGARPASRPVRAHAQRPTRGAAAPGAAHASAPFIPLDGVNRPHPQRVRRQQPRAARSCWARVSWRRGAPRAAGGYTAASAAVVDILRQRSRPYLFSNTVAPAVVGASLEALALLQESTALRDRLMANTARFRHAMTAARA